MKTTRIIALLLCLVMVIGYAPMAISAEGKTLPTGKVEFDELIDFETGTVGNQVDVNDLNATINQPTLFKVEYAVTTSADSGKHTGRTYARATEDDSIALRSYGGRGIFVEDTTLALLSNNFVIEFDANVDVMYDQHYTYVGWYVNDGTEDKRASLMAINPAGSSEDGVTYPGSYSQSGGLLSKPSQTCSIMKEDTWHHFTFYFNIDGKTVNAYRDGVLLYTTSLVIPTTAVSSKIFFHSGANWKGTAIYYDNIHIKSLHDIDVSLDFETSDLSATAAGLTAELDDEFITVPHYIEALNTIETAGTDNYLTIKVDSHNLQTADYKCANFFIEDRALRLSYRPWILSFDWKAPGTVKGDQQVDFTTSGHGFVTFKHDAINGGNKGSTTSLLGIGSDGKLMFGSTPSSVVAKVNTWYRFNIVYNPQTHKADIYMDGKLVGSTPINTEGSAANLLRFGYSWSGLYYKHSFDNISLKTYDIGAPLDIYVDFENGTAGEALIPADLSYGGLLTYGTKYEKGSFNTGKNALSSIKYVKEENGNTVIKTTDVNTAVEIVDASNRTLKEKFVVSFDMKFAQWYKSDYTMTRWVTSSGTKGVFVLSSAGKLCLRSGLTGGYSGIKQLELNTWYNLAVVIDPVNKTASFYVDGLDTTPIYTTTCPDVTADTYSAFALAPASYEAYIDNFRVYTVENTAEKAEYPDSFITAELPADKVFVNTDFESFGATEITASAFDGVAPFKAAQANGIVTEVDGNKYLQSNGNGALSFNVSSTVSTPIENGVMAIETDFTFGDNSANGGNLAIASIRRVNGNGAVINAPLVTVDKDGTVTVASQATAYKLPAETVKMRIEFSYAFHTVNLYVNGKAIATGIPLSVALPMTLISTSVFTDATGTEYQLPYTGSAFDYIINKDGTIAKSANGKTLYRLKTYENYKFAESAAYIKDYVDMFEGKASADSWSFAIDNLKIYMDDDADLLTLGFDGWTNSTAPNSEPTVQNVYKRADGDLNIIDYNGNMVASTAPNKYEGSLHINEKIGYLLDKTYVFEFDMTFNEELEDISLNDTSILAYTKNTWRNILRLNNKGEVISDNGSTVFTTMTKDKWTKVQVLVAPGANGTKVGHVYIDGIKALTTGALYGEMQFRIGNEGSLNYDMKWDNVRIYLADVPDAYEPTISGTLDGNKLIQLDVFDDAELEAVMANTKEGVQWNFKDFDTTALDINGSTVNVLLKKDGYVRVNHLNLKDSSDYNITVMRAALEGHKQYVIETEIRYYCSTGFDLEVATIFDAETQTYDKLLYIPGASGEICFNRNGYSYPLTDALGNKLYAEAVTEDATEFTKLALIVDEEAGTYSIYVNDAIAYFDCDGVLTTASAIEIDKTKLASTSTPDSLMSTIVINNISASSSATALLDIKSVNLYALRTGVAPYVMATQSKTEATTYDVRFIAALDMLYGKEVGFEVTTTHDGSKELTRTSNLVYSSIKAYDEETDTERDFSAEEFDGTYLATLTVNKIAVVDTVVITVKPFIIIGDSKIYNESFTVTYSQGEVIG